MAEHLSGRDNEAADALSRGNLDLLFSQVPAGEKEPTAVPTALLGILVHSQPDWTSRTWRRQFADTLQWD